MCTFIKKSVSKHRCTCRLSKLVKEELEQGRILMPADLVTFKIQRYYQDEPRFNGIYVKKNLPKITVTA